MEKYFDKVYGLIGRTLGHSFSQTYFNQKFSAENINSQYVNFELPDIEDFPSIIARTPNLSGLNVTIPYKEKIIPYLDQMDPVATRIGAVNVIKIIRNSHGEISTLKGYNTDIIGFSGSLRPLLKSWHTKALILGSGGASKAVACGLSDLGIESVIVSRTPAPGRFTYGQLTPEIMAEHTVIVNTTPLGMYPHTDKAPDILYEYVTSRHICYDLLYNPDTTLFMKKCAEYGATTKNGLEMLLLQAFAAWHIWQS